MLQVVDVWGAHARASSCALRQPVVKNASIPESALSKRHNAINYNIVRESVAAGILHVRKEDGTTNLADAFTKLLACRRQYDLFSRIGYSSMFRSAECGIKWDNPESPTTGENPPFAPRQLRFIM